MSDICVLVSPTFIAVLIGWSVFMPPVAFAIGAWWQGLDKTGE